MWPYDLNTYPNPTARRLGGKESVLSLLLAAFRYHMQRQDLFVSRLFRLWETSLLKIFLQNVLTTHTSYICTATGTFFFYACTKRWCATTTLCHKQEMLATLIWCITCRSAFMTVSGRYRQDGFSTGLRGGVLRRCSSEDSQWKDFKKNSPCRCSKL